MTTLAVAGPNLTIDRTTTLPGLTPGAVLRTGPVAVTPGGKGVNVVRAVTRLGVDARVVAYAAGRLGEAAIGMLGDEGVPVRPVRIAGELRSTLVVTDDAGRVTVVNEPGPTLGAGDWARLEAAVGEELAHADGLVCSGSIPPGAPADAYARLVALAHRRGVPAFVDAAGAVLDAALAAGPDAVLPNLAEAEAVLGRAHGEAVEPGADARDRAALAARDLRARGAEAAVVTAGAAGAAVAADAVDPEEPGVEPVAADGVVAFEDVAWVPARAVMVANPIGAGDAFTAGYAVAVLGGAPPPAAVRQAVAVAAAAVEDPRAGALDPRRVAELGGRIGFAP